MKEEIEMIDLSKATEIAREWIRENIIINLYYHMFMVERATQVGYEDKWLVVCSIQKDFGKREFYVFEISFKGKVLKVGIGTKEGNTIHLKKFNLKWEEKNEN